MTTYKDAIREVFPQAQFEGEQGLAADVSNAGKLIAEAYTSLVDALRRNPNERLATLGRTLWEIVNHRHVHTALYEGVTVVTFTVVARENSPRQGIILIPPLWLQIVTQEPLMGVGSIIFTGSQAVDYYNDRLSTEGSKLLLERAYSYEAEFLKAFRQLLPLNDYQKAVLRDYPEGFDVEKYGYNYRPVAPEPS
jgi:hypothetical protein